MGSAGNRRSGVRLLPTLNKKALIFIFLKGTPNTEIGTFVTEKERIKRYPSHKNDLSSWHSACAILYSMPFFSIWPAAWQNQQNDMCAQWRLINLRPPSLIRVFAVSMTKHWALNSGRMPRLIWVFAGRTCHFVSFVLRRLIPLPFGVYGRICNLMYRFLIIAVSSTPYATSFRRSFFAYHHAVKYPIIKI